MSPSPSLDSTIAVAHDVVLVLSEHHIEALIIGAMALAVHGYARATRDLDLAVATEPERLHVIAEALRDKGYEVEVREPDANDPLGGVIDVRSPDADLVQIVNFDNPPAEGFPRLVKDALVDAIPLTDAEPLRVVDAYHLVAFKLYAGGRKSQLDVLELLEANPTLDRERLRELCDGYRLGHALDRLLRDA